MELDFVRARYAVAELLKSFGIDTSSPELEGTPDRVASFWAERLEGYNFDFAIELVPLAGQVPACPIILERIPFTSTCEHHLAPFSGHATLGYVPGNWGVVGLSKLIKLVHAFANRLQVQENLTAQIFGALETYLQPSAWGVKIVAEHSCIAHRGVKTQDVPVTTTLIGGTWQQDTPIVFQ
ncbi:MAG: GTP cyclohydrolase I [Holophagaceae bacterium]|nr:GTP cyclohydrolase I [Holophagaceae bacterium]